MKSKDEAMTNTNDCGRNSRIRLIGLRIDCDCQSLLGPSSSSHKFSVSSLLLRI